MDCSMPGLSVHHRLPEFTQTHAHWVGDAIQPSHPLSSPSPTAFNLPSIRVFSNESALHIRWRKYWSFTFSISPCNEYSGLISFDWLVGSPWVPRDSQESSPTPQFKSINSSVLSFFTVKFSCLYMTTGKTIALTRQAFVSKVTSQLFNMLSRLVIAFFQEASVF